MSRLRLLSILGLLFTVAISVEAQKISIAKFYLDEKDGEANRDIVYDQNGEKCALIKVETTQKGFVFDTGTLGVVSTRQKTGEIWVYVPAGVKRITISHEKLGVLRNQDLGMTLQKAKTYIMQLTTAEIYTNIIETLDKQFLIFNVTPRHATIEVDGEPWTVDAEGHAERNMSFGTYTYRIMAPDYHTSTGKVTLDDPEHKHIEDIALKPNFGWVHITDATGISGAEVYIDNIRIGKVPIVTQPLKSGTHKLKITKPLYKMYECDVTVTDADTTTLDPHLEANFAETTLTVDADAEIWIDGERRGKRKWTGPLAAGEYLVECRQEGHRTTSRKINITRNTSGDIILPPPIPIYGFLEITSTPSNAQVTLDGKPIGQTPLNLSKILIGNHTLSIARENYKTEMRTITLAEGKTEAVSVTLSNICHIAIQPTPTDANVYIDGKLLGTGMQNLDISSGAHEIKLEANGYDTLKKTVNIDGTTGTYQFKMKSNQASITVSTNRFYNIYVDGKSHDVHRSSSSNNQLLLLPNGTHKIEAKHKHWHGEHTVHVNSEPQTVYIKMKRDNVTKNEFYLEGNYQFGSLTTMGGTLGFYISNINFECSFLTGSEKSETVYWNVAKSDSYTYSPSSNLTVSYSPEKCFTAKIGYGIRAGNRIRITPQAGFGTIICNDDMEIKSVYGILSARFSYAVNSWFGISLTPGIAFPCSRSKGYEAVAGVSPTVDKFDKGFNLKTGLVIYL